MKKQWSMILIMTVLCVMLAGCGNTTTPTAPSESVTSPTNEQTDVIPTDSTPIPEPTATADTALENDEDAIKQVVLACVMANYNWDIETMQACLVPGSDYSNPYEMSKQGYQYNVENGLMSEEYMDEYIELNRSHNAQLGTLVQAKTWDITVSGDTATATVIFAYPEVDYSKLFGKLGMLEFEDQLYTQICGMDKNTARNTLSLDAFTEMGLQVKELEFQKQMECVMMVDYTADICMKKIDNEWYIVKVGN